MQLTYWLEALTRQFSSRRRPLRSRRQSLSERWFSRELERLDRRIVLSASDISTIDGAAIESASMVLVGPELPAAATTADASEWILQLAPGAESLTADELAAGFHLGAGTLEVVSQLGAPGLIEIRVTGVTDEALTQALQVSASVSSFEPNDAVTGAAVPNDTQFADQTELQRIGAVNAWNLNTNSSPLVVAVIDSGIDFTSPDLYLNIWLNQGEIPAQLRAQLRDDDGDGLITFRDLNRPVNAGFVSDLNHTGYIDAGDLLLDPGWRNHLDEDGNGKADDLIGWDFTDNDLNPYDENGHGTHVSGILAATGNNGAGIAGVNWGAQIMVVKFLDDRLHGETANAISALNYVTQFRTAHLAGQPYAPDVRLSNNSWEIRPSTPLPALSAAIAAQSDSGILLVAAAGNGVSEVPQNLDIDPNASLPAAHAAANLLTVAAVDSRDQLLINSNYGATRVDLAAPGLDILSTERNGAYGTRTGTSMATPFVTGTAALFWSLYPQATAAEVRDALLKGVDLVPSLTGKVASGGRLNIERTLGYDTVAPRAQLSPIPDIISKGGTYQDITVTYTDNLALSAASLGVGDLVITRTDGTVLNSAITVQSQSSVTNASTITVTYRLTAPNGTWSNADNGVLQVRWVADQVSDAVGNKNSATLLGTITINVPAPDDFRVTSTVDSTDRALADGRVEDAQFRATLRAAIQEANSEPDANVIKLNPGTYTLTLAGGGEDFAATGDLDIRQSLTIVGDSAATTIIDAAALDRVFHVLPGVSLTLRNLTIRGGQSSDTRGGGGILNEGFLTLDHVVVTANTAGSGGGGGILNNVSTASSNETFTVIDSQITGNQATGSDGGGMKVVRGKGVIQNSTIDNNFSSQAGGGLSILLNTVSMTNVTVSQNYAGTTGGGIQLAGGVLVLTNGTVTQNYANSAGGGIARSGGTTRLVNTIVAGNTLGLAMPDVDVSGTFSAAQSGNNFIGIIGNAAGFSAGSGDQIGTAGSPLSANLAPLANYGGSTPTHRPNVGSPVIDAGRDVAGLNTDQRGQSRKVDGDNSGGAAIDIGAVEFVYYASVVGNVFYDLDQNGSRNGPETGLANWTVYLDTNDNGILDSGEKSTLSNVDGGYRFDNVVPGNYVVREVLRFSSAQTFVPSTPINLLQEDFDGVSAPALPAGWSTTGNGAWTTVAGGSHSGINHAFIPDPGTTTDNALVSPVISLTQAMESLQLKFSHSFNTENQYDGGVLEISINGGAFTDIIAAGGTFVSGGYSQTFGFSSVLAGKSGWIGNSGGYINTVVTLPGVASGSSIQLRWRFTSDYVGAETGWNVDSFSLTGTGAAWSQTTPASPGKHEVSIAPGTNNGPFNFGNYATPGEIQGREFQDTNGNGLQDNGEPGLPGRVVFLDLNGNNLLDDGEQSTITDANGDYIFTGLPTQFWYSVVAMPVEGWESTSIQATFNLGRLLAANGGTGREGTVFAGKVTNGNAGLNISSAGDINGDSLDDFLVGNGFYSGANGEGVYVVFGTEAGWPANFSLSNLNGTNGFAIDGYAGQAVSAAGDFNGDGYDDILLGRPNNDVYGTLSGSAYVIFGKARGFSPLLRLADLDGSNGFAMHGSSSFESLGSHVGGVGDVNDDGFDDILISSSFSSRAYLVFGRGTTTATFDLATLDGLNGTRLDGVPYARLAGLSSEDSFHEQTIDSAGDLNGDHINDLVIGEPENSLSRGRAYVLFGRPAGVSWGASINLAALDSSTGFIVQGTNTSDLLGVAVAGTGDFNGDGLDDLAIGAHQADPHGSDSGAVYIVFGRYAQANPFPTILQVSALDGTNGFRLSGVNTSDAAGEYISAVGDFNGDGLADLVISAANADPNGANSGSAYLVFGSSSAWSENFDLSALNGQNGMRLDGIAAGQLAGRAVAGVGDVNGDGLADLLVGSFINSTGASSGGAAFLIYGRAALSQRVWLEAAELRLDAHLPERPLPGELRGVVFNDRDRDGIHDAGEEGVANIQVFLDLNSLNGSWDPGEPIATTNANGEYVFSNLDAYTSIAVQSRSYRVVELVDIDRLEYVQSAPQKLLGAVEVTPFVVDSRFRTGFGISSDGQGGLLLSSTDGSFNGYNQQQILRVSSDGQAVSYLAAADHPQGVTSDGVYAYWVDLNAESSQTRIYRQLLSGGSRELLYSSVTPGSSTNIVAGTDLDFVAGEPGSLIAVDGSLSQLWQLSAGNATLTQNGVAIGAPRSGGSIQQTHAQFLDVVDGIAYIADPGYLSPDGNHALDLPARLLAISLADGSLQVLYEGDLPAFQYYDVQVSASRPAGIAVHDGTIYVTGERAIYSLPTTGGTPVAVIADERFQHLADLTFDDGTLYVIDNGTSNLATVWRVDLSPRFQFSIDVDLTSNTRAWDVVLTPGQKITGLDIARYDPNSAIGASGSQSIRGIVFDDLDGNGIQNGEPGLNGVQVFLDLNHTGVLDEGDLVTVTVNGEYVFEGLSAGLYDVLLADPALQGRLTSGQRIALAPNDLVPPTGNSTGTPRAVATGDINNDGLKDLIIADSETGKVSVWKNIGDDRFTKLATELNVGGIPSAVALVNLNGDNLPDLAISSAQYGSISLWKNLGNGSFVKQPTSNTLVLRSSANATDYGVPSTIVTADFNTDGRMDLAVIDSHPSYNRIFVFLRDTADFSFKAPQILTTPGVAKGLIAGQLNSADQAFDLAATIPGTDQLVVWLNLNDGTGKLAASGQATTVGHGPAALTLVQANGDAYPDLAVANVLDGTITLLANNGAAGWSTLSTLALTSAPTNIVAANLDGRFGPDLVVTLGNGSDSSQPLAVFYHTGDNATPYAQTVVYGASIFDFSAVATATGLGLAVSNLDTDADEDLVVVNSAAKTISVLRNGPATSGQTVRLTVGGASANATHIDFGVRARHAVTWNAGTGQLVVTLLNPGELELAARGARLELRIEGTVDQQIDIAIADIKSIIINGSSGADRIDLSGVNAAAGFTRAGGVAVTIYGNAGNDTITGSGFGDVIDGGEGNNIISGGDGDDNIIAGSGDDILFGGDGDDVLNGQTGANRLDGGAGTNTLLGNTINLPPTFTAGGNIIVDEDAGPRTFANWATEISPGAPNETSQTLNFIVDADLPALFSVVPAIAANGTLTFTPAANVSGTTTVSVKLHDNGGTASGGVDTSPVQTFTITINPINDPPLANVQSVNTNESTALSITLTGTDGDPERTQVLTFAIVTQPSHGTLTNFNAATGQVTYTPTADYNGPDSFTFTVTDDAAAGGAALTSTPATVSIGVTAINIRPTATPQSVTTDEGTPLVLTLAGVDGDPEVTQTLTFAIVNQPAHGTLTNFNPATGQVTYTPAADYNGQDSFTFTVTDDTTAGGAALTSTAATVSIGVTAVNARPTATPQSVTTNESTALVLTLAGVDGDPERTQVLTFAIVDQPAHGTLTNFNAATGQVTYNPTADYNGADSFTFTVTDDATAGGAALTSTAATVSISVTAINVAPTGTPQSASTNEGTALALTLAGLDGDPEVTQTLTFAIVNQPAHGTLTNFNAATGQVTYTPAADYNGADSFTFTVTDDTTAGGAARTSTAATVQLTVNPVNAQPVANGQTLTLAQESSLVITLTGTDGDPEVSQTLTFAIAAGPQHGTLGSINQATGQVTYTPAAGYIGADSFTFTVTDDGTAGGAARTSVAALIALTVTEVTGFPLAFAQLVTMYEGQAPALVLVGDDGNVAVNRPLTFAIVQGPGHGTLSGFNPATGQVTYTPDPNYNGVDSLTFSVTDDLSQVSSPATVSLTIAPVNAQPTANAQAVSTTADTAKVITLSGADGDPEVVQSLTFAIASQPAHGTLTGFNAQSGQVTYTPFAGYSGSDSFTFTITDDGTAGGTARTSTAATVDITVSPVVVPTVTLGITQGLLAEAGGSTQVTATLSSAASAPVTITLSFAGTATETVDYSRSATQITIPAGQLTGLIVLTAIQDGLFEGQETIVIQIDTVTNAVEDGQQQVSLQITDDDHVPAFTSSSTADVDENTTAVMQVTATDADLPSQTLTFTITGGPDQARFNITAGGLLSFVTAPDFENPADENGDNLYLVQVTVNDGQGGVADQLLMISVSNVAETIPAQLTNNGPPASWKKKQPAVTVMPLIEVVGNSFGGSVLQVSLQVVGKKKPLDTYTLPSTTAIGTITADGPATGQRILQIQLSENTTAAAIQSFLRGITFQTKGGGVKQTTRAITVKITDADNHVTSASQTIQVRAK